MGYKFYNISLSNKTILFLLPLTVRTFFAPLLRIIKLLEFFSITQIIDLLDLLGSRRKMGHLFENTVGLLEHTFHLQTVRTIIK